MEEDKKITVRSFMDISADFDFNDIDLTEIQEVIATLKEMQVIDLHHADLLQQKSLYGADQLNGYIAKLVKQIGITENKITAAKNKASLNFKADEGKTTADMKIWAGTIDQTAIDLSDKLAELKGINSLLNKKYDGLLKTYYYYKSISDNYRRTTALGFTPVVDNENNDWQEYKHKVIK